MSFPRFFRNASIEDTFFFDEGPRTHEAKVIASAGTFVNTSSIDTSAIDAYRQGVELTQQKHFDKGVVKIHAGEPGHVIRQNHFGMNKNTRPEPAFEELNVFNPVTFIRTQQPIEPQRLDLDGVIEPFSIREVALFLNVDVPFAARSVKAIMMAGNVDPFLGTDQILTVDEFSERLGQGFLDLGKMFSTEEFFSRTRSPLSPFLDRRLPGNFTPSAAQGTSIRIALSQMNGSTENYINENERSATSGWQYDNTSVGTDSLNFGGMMH
jgi:hypothetical protein